MSKTATSAFERMIASVSAAATLFEARWTMNALMREAPDLHEALEEQIGMFHEALSAGYNEEIILHGEATVRGWQAAIKKMEQSGIADDAIHIGQFGDCVVAVGRQRKAPDWFREQYGSDVAWLTPREVAAMYFRIREVDAVKQEWPDAEIIELRGKSK